MRELTVNKNNKSHQEALDVVEQFKANGGVVTVLDVCRSSEISFIRKPKKFISANEQPKDL